MGPSVGRSVAACTGGSVTLRQGSAGVWGVSWGRSVRIPVLRESLVRVVDRNATVKMVNNTFMQ